MQPLQQLLAQPLPLRQLHIDFWHRSSQDMPALNMAALVRLQEFTAATVLPEGSVLPPQLQQLHLGAGAVTAGSLSMVMPLQQLQRLTVMVYFEEQEPLLRLAQLPALQHLMLDYGDEDCAAATAAAWPQLPQLRELDVGDDNFCPSKVQMEAILAGIVPCSGLTRLQLGVHEVTREDGLAVAACSRLTGLSRLKDLALTCEYGYGPWLAAGDALALTALTGLTSLIMTSHGSALGNLEANALACNLQQLCHLDLSNNELGSMVCLAAVARLTQLTELVLYDGDGLNELTQRGVMMLTGLSRLQKLGVGISDKVTAQVLQRFWAAVRGQQQQQQQQTGG
jgi:hypothetical protein